jgi:hypothetical protein
VSEAWRLSLDVAGAFGTPVRKEWTADQEDLEFPPDPDFQAEASNTREKKRKAKRGDEWSQEIIRQFDGCIQRRANNLKVSNTYIPLAAIINLTLSHSMISERPAKRV